MKAQQVKGSMPFIRGTTNVFNIASAVTIDLGFVDTSTGKAVPTNNPLNISGRYLWWRKYNFPTEFDKARLTFVLGPVIQAGTVIMRVLSQLIPHICTASTTKVLVLGDRKRNLSDGALVVGFGTGGVVTNPAGAVIGRVISQLTPHIWLRRN